MMKLTFLPTCDPNVLYCRQTRKMYVSIIKNTKLIYIPLTQFLENPKKYKLNITKIEVK